MKISLLGAGLGGNGGGDSVTGDTSSTTHLPVLKSRVTRRDFVEEVVLDCVSALASPSQMVLQEAAGGPVDGGSMAGATGQCPD